MDIGTDESANDDADFLPSDESWWKRSRWAVCFTIAAVLFIVLGGSILVVVPNQLLNNWFPDVSDDVRAASLWPAAQVVLFSLGGVIAIAGIALSGARHGEELRAADRDRARSLVQQRLYHLDRDKEASRLREMRDRREADAESVLRARLVTAVELLASDASATKRMTGLFLLAGLVSEWKARENSREAQLCVDVLCGYLRAAPRVDDEASALLERQVRVAGFEQIRTNLTDSGEGGPLWAGLHFNLTGLRIDYTVNLSRIRCEGSTKLNLERIEVLAHGRLLLPGIRVADDSVLSLNGASVLDGGEVHLQEAQLRNDARMTAVGVDVSRNGRLILSDAVLQGNSDLLLGGPTISAGGELVAKGLILRDDAELVINRAVVTSQGRLVASGARACDRASVLIGSPSVRGFVDLRGLRLQDQAHVEVGKPRVSARGRLDIDHWRAGESSTMLITAAQVEARGLLSLRGGLAEGGIVNVSVLNADSGGHVTLHRTKLLSGGRLVVRGARWDGEGRVWMNADSISDARSRFLGRVSLSGGDLAS
ncbi:hypothetical protein [Agrococcus terreus]|uniref:hypothetical protein n=1 Tax=Agrococcus terreus TaxID=574649 RepID=UPI00166C58D1|nr:hypothetical protein [Agrococcus terreus]